MIKQVLCVLFIAQYFFVHAQQLPLFTQHTPYLTTFNPAALSSEYFSDYQRQTVMGLASRWQWTTQIPDAPRTYLLRADHSMPIKNNTFSLLTGGHILSDALGPIAQNQFSLRVGAHGVGKKGGISAGLTMNYTAFQFDAAKITLRQPSDILGIDVHKTSYTDIGMGIFAHFKPNAKNTIYGGFSVLQLYSSDVLWRQQSTDFGYKKVPHIYGMVGYVKRLGERHCLETTAWVRSVQNTPLYIDLNSQVHLNFDNQMGFIVGLGCSTSGRLQTSVGFITKNYFSYVQKIVLSVDKHLFAASTFINQGAEAYEISLIYAFGSPK